MTTLKQGDLIKDKYGVRKVLGVCGDVVHVSFVEDHNAINYTKTESEFKANGYTWDTPAWEPEIGSIYWYIVINGEADVQESNWDNDEHDHARRDFLGIYQTSDLGEAALLEIRRKLGK